ncbi:MAG TPA: flagellar motor protein MotB [Microscillaceae bacterium]|nr:flagellar motor protein MotB [Microscillaceae bacterium]
MRKTLTLGLMAIIGLSLSSCLVAKKKYDAEVAAKNKLIKEKRRLQADKRNLQKQVAGLKSDTTRLGKELRDLQNKYNALFQSSRLTTNDLRKKLNEREKELQRKEKLLADREAVVKKLQDAIDRKDKLLKNLLSKVQNALKNFNPDELTVTSKNGKIYVSLSEKLLFKSGRTDVDRKGKRALGKLAEVLKKNQDIDIQIEGHTDSIPIRTAKFKDNWDLSVLRATSIVRILTKDYEVDPKILTPAGKGEGFPVASNKDKEGRARNRRIEIVLSPKLEELLKLLEN